MGLQDEMKEIKELLKEKEKGKTSKKFKIPFGKKVSKAQAKKNWVTMIKVNENGHINWSKEKIEDQTIMVDNVPRLATPEYILRAGKTPLIIQPSWSVEPYNPKKDHESSILKGSNSAGYRILLASMLAQEIKTKKPMGNLIKIIIGLGLAAIVGYAIISGGGI